MDPMVGLLGGAVGGLFNFLGTNQTNQNNMDMLRQQQQYQTQMANTAYQRASQDMQAAGLNPSMMFGSGGPAATPNSPSAQPRQSPMGGIGDSISKALNNMVTAKTVEKMSDEIALLKAERGVKLAQAVTEGKRPAQVEEQTHLMATERGYKQNIMPVARLAGASAKDILNMPEGMRGLANQGAFLGDKAGAIIAPITDAIGSAGGLLRHALSKRAFEESLKPKRTTRETSTQHVDGGSQSFEERWAY